jgi:hypothetical protein
MHMLVTKDDEYAAVVWRKGEGTPWTDRRSDAARVQSVRHVQGGGAWRGANVKVSQGVGQPGEGTHGLGRLRRGATRHSALAGNRFNIGHFTHVFL